MIHTPVLIEEAVSLLQVKPDGKYVDCTAGAGGHAERIAERLGPQGLLIGMDRDAEILKAAQERLSGRPNVKLFLDNYANTPAILRELGINGVDGILLDAGVSTLQISDPERGFSFQKEGPLDMRMDRRQAITAAQVVNSYPQEEIEQMIREFGEERFSRVIARAIVNRRRSSPFATTRDLAETVSAAVPRGKKQKIHPATRTFQGIRIYVNSELENLARLISCAPAMLNPGGRIAVISFHSLEDRIVKRSFESMREQGLLSIVTRKAVVPAGVEIEGNYNSRSAKLRAAERT